MVEQNDLITKTLLTFLDVQSKRTQLIASNIANADTPGFSAKELNFQDVLKEAANEIVEGKNSSNPLPTQLKVVEQQNGVLGIDGNNVDTMHEMSVMAETGMQYNLGVQLLQSRWRTLRLAIKEGR
jgi:flagellar basal-body rod protein FlgB